MANRPSPEDENATSKGTLSGKVRSCSFPELISNKFSPPKAPRRLEFGIGYFLTIGRPTQRARQPFQGRDVKHFLIAAIQVRAQQAILADFGIVATDVGHPASVGRKRERRVHVLGHGLWRTS